jgi:hypothetical protein
MKQYDCKQFMFKEAGHSVHLSSEMLNISMQLISNFMYLTFCAFMEVPSNHTLAIIPLEL